MQQRYSRCKHGTTLKWQSRMFKINYNELSPLILVRAAKMKSCKNFFHTCRCIVAISAFQNLRLGKYF